MEKKRILIVLDGLGDLPSNKLKNKTPLEAASTPYLDKLTKKSRLGYMYTIKPGVSPESDTSTLAILGYDPYKTYTGRGPLEAAGTSLYLGKNFLALRANFATVTNNQLSDRRVGRDLSTKEARHLSETINKKVKLPYKFKFFPTIQHRGILVIYSKLSPNISNVDPAYVKKGKLGIAVKSNKLKPCKPLDKSKLSKLTADVINNFTFQVYNILSNHRVNKLRVKKNHLPGNYILLRDAGNKLPNLNKKKDKWLAIAGMPLEIGLARLSGMNIYNFSYPSPVRDIYKSIYANLNVTLKAARLALKKHWKKYDSFYIHIKETDIPGHDGLPNEKKKMVELIDKELFKNVLDLKDCLICITADHSTPCILKRHSNHPVPVLIYGKGSDNLSKFSERNSKKGSFHKIIGKNLLKLIY